MDPLEEVRQYERAAAYAYQVRQAEREASIEMAINAAAYIDVGNFNGAGDAPIVAALSSTRGYLQSDTVRTAAILKTLAAVESGQTWEEKEEEPWWRKGDNLLKGGVRMVGMVGEAAVDTLFDRLPRAGSLVASGQMDVGDAVGGFFGFNQEAAAQIGNPILFGALGEASHDWLGNLTWASSQNRVNLGEGYIPNSDLSQSAADLMANAFVEYDTWEPTQEQLDQYSELGWDRNDLRLIKQTQGMRQSADWAGMAPGQASLGRPITQQSHAAREAVLLPIKNDRFGFGGVTQVSLGRIFAAQVVEPGTGAFDVTSGIADFIKQVRGDPGVMWERAAAASRATRRGLTVTREGAEALAQREAYIWEMIDSLGLAKRAQAGDRGAIIAMQMLLEADETDDLFRMMDTLDVVKHAKRGDESAHAVLRLVYGDEYAAKLLTDDDPYIALLTDASRYSVNESQAMNLIQGRHADAIVDSFIGADTYKEVDTLLAPIRGTFDGMNDMRRHLKNASSRAEVVDALLPHLSVVKFQTGLRPVQTGSMMRKFDTAAVGGGLLIGAGRGAYEGWQGGEGFGGRAWETLQGGFGGGVQGFLGGAAVAAAPNLIRRGGASTRAGSLTDLLMEAPRTMFDSMASTMWSRPDSLIGAGVRGNWRYANAQTRIGRLMSQNSPTTIDLENLDKSWHDIERWVQNLGLDKAMIEDQLDQLTRIGNYQPGAAFGVMEDISRIARQNLIDNGVKPEMADVVTKLIREAKEDGLFNLNATGDTISYPGTSLRALAGKPVSIASPQLQSELFGGQLRLPDPSKLRRIVSEQSRVARATSALTTDKIKIRETVRGISQRTKNMVRQESGIGMLDEEKIFQIATNPDFNRRWLLRMADAGVRRIWRPMVLLRIAFPVRIIGLDEQARMGAYGLDSMWRHPVSYFAYTLGKRGSGGKGMLATRRFSSLSQMDDALEAGTYGAIDFAEDWVEGTRSYNILGRNTDPLFGPLAWRKTQRGTGEYIGGLHTELNQLWSTEVVAHMHRNMNTTKTVMLDETVAYLKSDDGIRVLRNMTPDLTDAQRMAIPDDVLRKHLDGVYARSHLKAGGDWVYTDPDTGRVFTSADEDITDIARGRYESGYTITRDGHDEILESYRTGNFAGVHVYTPNTSGQIQLIKKRLKEIDQAGADLPEWVKYAAPERIQDPDLTTLYDRTIERLFDFFAGTPTAKLSRSPAFKQIYYQRMFDMMPYMDDATLKRFQKMAQADKMGRDFKKAAKALRKGDGPVGGMITDFLVADEAAKSYSLTMVQDLLFDLHKRANVSDAMWLVAPFVDAFIEVFSAWGKVVGMVPYTVTRRATQLVNGAREGDPQIETALGEALAYFGMDPDSLEKWGLNPEYEQQVDPIQGVPGAGRGFFHQNEFGQEVFTYPFAAAAVELIDKITPGEIPAMNLEASVGALNMAFGGMDISKGPQFLDIPMATFLPGFGPAIQWVSKTIPEQYKEIKELLNPFGEINAVTTFLPSPWMRRLFTGMGWTGGDERIFNDTVGDVMQMLMMNGRAGWGEEYDFDLSNSTEWQNLLKEAESQARNVFFIRSIASFTLPSTPSAPKFLADLPEEVPAAYKRRLATIDQMRNLYNMLLREGTWRNPDTNQIEEINWDHSKAIYEFNRILQQPEDWLMPYVFSVGATDTQFKRSLSEKGFDWERERKRIFDAAPRTAYYLTPPELLEGEFYYPAYEQQLADGVRVSVEPEDRLVDMQAGIGRLIWLASQKEIDENKAMVRAMRDNDEVNDMVYRALMAEINRYAVTKKREISDQYGSFDLYSSGADYSQQIGRQIEELYQWPEIEGLKEVDPETFDAVQEYLGYRDEALATLISINPEHGGQFGAGNTLMSRGQISTNPETMSFQQGVTSAIIRNWLRQQAELLYHAGNFGMIWDEILSREMPAANEEIYDLFGGQNG